MNPIQLENGNHIPCIYGNSFANLTPSNKPRNESKCLIIIVSIKVREGGEMEKMEKNQVAASKHLNGMSRCRTC